MLAITATSINSEENFGVLFLFKFDLLGEKWILNSRDTVFFAQPRQVVWVIKDSCTT